MLTSFKDSASYRPSSLTINWLSYKSNQNIVSQTSYVRKFKIQILTYSWDKEKSQCKLRRQDVNKLFHIKFIRSSLYESLNKKSCLMNAWKPST